MDLSYARVRPVSLVLLLGFFSLSWLGLKPSNIYHTFELVAPLRVTARPKLADFSLHFDHRAIRKH